MKLPVVYSQKMVAESGHEVSPSASKPAKVAEALRASRIPVEFYEPEPVSRDDFLRVHDPKFVNGVFDGRVDNGFGNRSADVARSLPYTSGAMVTAAQLALSWTRKKSNDPVIVAALCSGFHHATWGEAEGFCTFNGLMVCASRVLRGSWQSVEDSDSHRLKIHRLAIVDCDYHYGNGTDDILDRTGLRANVLHASFGKDFKRPDQAEAYLSALKTLETDLLRFQPELVLYQAGVDTHIDDPLGGCLTAEQMRERDEIVFRMCGRHRWPVVFNLAGGYQRDADGGISKVIQLHLQTFEAALCVNEEWTKRNR